MKYLYYSFLALIVLSCSENSATNLVLEDNPSDSLEIEIDSDTINELESELEAFTFLEDYLVFNNRDEIAKEFGEENLEDGSSWYAEGTVEIKHTILTRADNGQIIKFLWDQDNPKQLSSLEVNGNIWDENFEIVGQQKVETECGIFTGMSLAEVVKLNGARIDFSGFGWDYSGSVMNKNNGELDECRVSFRLDLENYDDPDSELIGDMELNSDMESVKKANIIVDEITVYKDSE